MAYELQVDGKATPFVDFKLQEILNKLDAFKFVLKNRDEFRGRIDHGNAVLFKFNGTELANGKIFHPTYQNRYIIISGRDKIRVLHDIPFTKDLYQDDTNRVEYLNEAANVVFGHILAGTGWTSGGCPTTQITGRFEYLSKWEAIVTLARMLGKDWWRSGSTQAKIGDKGSLKDAPPVYNIKESDEDSYEQWDKVIVRGFDLEGKAIEVTVGTGNKVKVIPEREAADVTTLTTIATKIYNDHSSPLKAITFPIDMMSLDSMGYVAGDSFALKDERKNIDDTFNIQKITRQLKNCYLDVSTLLPEVSSLIAKEKRFADYRQTAKLLIGMEIDRFGSRAESDAKIAIGIGESEEGYTIVEAVGAVVTLTRDSLDIQTAADAISGASIRSQEETMHFGKNPWLKVKATMDWTSGARCIVYLRPASGANSIRFFWKDDGHIYGVTTGGGSATQHDLGTFSANTPDTLEARYVSDKKVDFYRNRIWKARSTTYLPSTAMTFYSLYVGFDNYLVAAAHNAFFEYYRSSEEL